MNHTIKLTEDNLNIIEIIKSISNKNQTDLEVGAIKKFDSVEIVERGIQLDLAVHLIENDLPIEKYIQYRNCITNEYVQNKLIEYEYSRLLDLPKWKNCEPYGHFDDLFKLMTYHVMKQWKKNYKTNFRISSEGASINNIINRYFKPEKRYSYEISAYSSVCSEWVKQGIKDPSEEAKVTLTEDGIKFFEMYHRAIGFWYERDFLNKYEKNN